MMRHGRGSLMGRHDQASTSRGGTRGPPTSCMSGGALGGPIEANSTPSALLVLGDVELRLDVGSDRKKAADIGLL